MKLDRFFFFFKKVKLQQDELESNDNEGFSDHMSKASKTGHQSREGICIS